MSQTTRSRFSRPVPEPSPTVRVGPRDAEPVLLLHPFTTSHDVWSDVVPRLADGYDVVAATLPGHWGGPPLRRRDVTLAAYADGVEELLDDLGWETCHLVGNSIGGWLALVLARRGRARTVTAIAPAGGWRRWSRQEIVVGAKFLGLFLAALLGHALGDRVTRLGPLRPLALRLVSHAPRRVARERADNLLRAASCCPSFLPFLVSELRRGAVVDVTGLDRRVPVRLVLCERDVLLPPAAYGRPYAERMPDADVVVLRDVGHVPMLEAPGLVADTVLAHLRAHPAAGDPAGRRAG